VVDKVALVPDSYYRTILLVVQQGHRNGVG